MQYDRASLLQQLLHSKDPKGWDTAEVAEGTLRKHLQGLYNNKKPELDHDFSVAALTFHKGKIYTIIVYTTKLITL